MNEPVVPNPTGMTDEATQLEPFDFFDRKRSDGHLHWDEHTGRWDVFSYEANKRVLGDPKAFSSQSPLPTDQQNLIGDTFFNSDPPEHGKKRGVVEDFFTSEAVNAYEPMIRETAQSLFDDIESKGEMDAVGDLAYPLPVIIIANILGVPPEDRDQFKKWADLLIKAETTSVDDLVADQKRAGTEMASYFLDIIERRQEEPKDDLISILTQAEIDGEPISEGDMLGYCALMLIAGNITTTGFIGNCIRCFGNYDDENLFETLSDDRDGLDRAIEEVARYRSSVPAAGRVATRDMELYGKSISEGDFVLTWPMAANHDPAKFDSPGEFIPSRSPNPHIAFGYGVHSCIGGSLARLETRVALEVMMERLDDIRVITDDLTPIENTFMHAVESLPVEFN
ncbi:cytochrome P450 [Haloarcula amylolytica]|nr:cytochrome P450 [Haloarcula amylolytica]